ncbi:MAG: hypothetical protein IPK16_05080 [Anaerolineales bacterium]|nr:hypothetical protein [Anaerolineales bacterium]
MIVNVQDAIRRTRQHHALEHATLHILAGRFPGRRMAGYSDPGGFTLFGNLTEDAVRRGVSDALLRLQAGESGLAIHANCGTNLAVTGVLATLAVLLGSAGRQRDPLGRFTGGLLFVLPALVVSQPLGLRLQQYTTLASVSDRWVKGIRPITLAGIGLSRRF